MWFLFHRKAKTRHVVGGETMRQRCPECRELATFHEVEIAESYGVFFVDIVKDRERAFRCGACGELFDLKDQGRTVGVTTGAAAPKEMSWDRVEELAAEQRRRDEERGGGARFRSRMSWPS